MNMFMQAVAAILCEELPDMKIECSLDGVIPLFASDGRWLGQLILLEDRLYWSWSDSPIKTFELADPGCFGQISEWLLSMAEITGAAGSLTWFGGY